MRLTREKLMGEVSLDGEPEEPVSDGATFDQQCTVSGLT